LYGAVAYKNVAASAKLISDLRLLIFETLKHDAREKLRIDTPREDVIRFFEENGFPVS